MSKWNLYLVLLSVVFVGCQSEPPGEGSGTTEASQVVSENQQPEIDAAQAPLVAPADVAITVDSPTQKDPVNVGMALGRASVAPGEQVRLVLRAHVAEGWHIYAAAGPTGRATARTGIQPCRRR